MSHPRIRVAALMLWQDKIVLVRHLKDNQEYHLLPGGGVAWGETLVDALKREVLEESGLLCIPGEVVLVHDSIAPDDTRHVVNIIFSAELDEFSQAHKSIDHRVVGVDLVAPEGLNRLDLRPPIAPDLVSLLQGSSDRRPRYTGSNYV